MAWATAWRAATWDPTVDFTLNSSDRKVSDGWIELWALGRALTEVERGQGERPGLGHRRGGGGQRPDPAGVGLAVGHGDRAEHRLRAPPRRVPDQDGRPAETEATSSGPADRSTAGSKVANPVFQPTLRAMWAGTMWSNMIRQSAKGWRTRP